MNFRAFEILARNAAVGRSKGRVRLGELLPPRAADPTGAGESRCAFVISSNIRCHWLSEAAWRRPADGLPASRLWDATRFPAERPIVKMNNDVSAKNARV